MDALLRIRQVRGVRYSGAPGPAGTQAARTAAGPFVHGPADDRCLIAGGYCDLKALTGSTDSALTRAGIRLAIIAIASTTTVTPR